MYSISSVNGAYISAGRFITVSYISNILNYPVFFILWGGGGGCDHHVLNSRRTQFCGEQFTHILQSESGIVEKINMNTENYNIVVCIQSKHTNINKTVSQFL
jgi:hypothetical protein